MTLWTILENSLWILQKGVSKCLNSIFWWLVFESWVSNFKTCALSGFLQMISDDFQKHEAIFSKIFQHSFKKFMDYSHWSLLKLVVFCCDISWFNSLYWIYSVVVYSTIIDLYFARCFFQLKWLFNAILHVCTCVDYTVCWQFHFFFFSLFLEFPTHNSNSKDAKNWDYSHKNAESNDNTAHTAKQCPVLAPTVAHCSRQVLRLHKYHMTHQNCKLLFI